MKIHIDEKDIIIIRTLWSSKIPLSSYAIAKLLYPELKDEYELSKKSIPIKSKIKKLLKYGFLFSKTINSKSYYEINRKNLQIGNGVLNFSHKGSSPGCRSRRNSIPLGNAMLLRTSSSNLQVIQLI